MTTPYRQAAKWEARIIVITWVDKNGDLIKDWYVKAAARLADALNDGWSIVSQSEGRDNTITYTLTRLK